MCLIYAGRHKAAADQISLLISPKAKDMVVRAHCLVVQVGIHGETQDAEALWGGISCDMIPFHSWTQSSYRITLLVFEVLVHNYVIHDKLKC